MVWLGVAAAILVVAALAWWQWRMLREVRDHAADWVALDDDWISLDRRVQRLERRIAAPWATARHLRPTIGRPGGLDTSRRPLMDLRDLAFKTLWTGIAAALAFVVQASGDTPTWWAPVLTMAATAALVFVRQKATPAPPPG